MSISLDLGCGPELKSVFRATEVFGINIDNFGNSMIKVADLAIDPIPFADYFLILSRDLIFSNTFPESCI